MDKIAHKKLSEAPKETGLWQDMRAYCLGGPVAVPKPMEDIMSGGDVISANSLFAERVDEVSGLIRFDRWTGYYDVFGVKIFENDLALVRGNQREVGLIKWGWAVGMWTVCGDNGTSLLIPWPGTEEGFNLAIVGTIHEDNDMFDCESDFLRVRTVCLDAIFQEFEETSVGVSNPL